MTIGTPDHWHGLMTVHACEAGKDGTWKNGLCYIEEGQAMLAAAATRAWCRSDRAVPRTPPTMPAVIPATATCKVSKVTCWHYENPVGDWTPNATPPPELDWELWLGPARWMPYNPNKVHFNFRWLLDFGGGQIRDRGAHVMSVALWCMNADQQGPASIEATGEPPHQGIGTARPPWRSSTNSRIPAGP